MRNKSNHQLIFIKCALSSPESALSGPSSPSNLSSVTLVGSTGSGGQEKADDTPTDINPMQFKYGRAPTSPLPERIRRPSFQRDTLKEEPGESVAAAVSTTITTTTIITHPPPVVMTTPCVSSNGEGRVRGGSLKVDPQITINLPKPSSSGGNHHQHQQTLSISPPHVSFDRRPSVGANVIPQAALCQHRHSLQLNGDGGIYKVRQFGLVYLIPGQTFSSGERNDFPFLQNERSSPRMIHRVPKTPDKQKKNSFAFGTPQREPR